MSSEKHIHVHPVLAAGAVEVSPENPHHTPAPPSVFTLSPAQIELIKTLHFKSDYEIAHMPKTAPDVALAFDDATIAAIEAHAELGGKARADRIRKQKHEYDELSAIASIVGPIARIVGQALLTTGAALANEAGEPLKVSHALAKTKPELLEKLTAIQKWSVLHHRHGRQHLPPPPPPPKA